MTQDLIRTSTNPNPFPSAWINQHRHESLTSLRYLPSRYQKIQIGPPKTQLQERSHPCY